MAIDLLGIFRKAVEPIRRQFNLSGFGLWGSAPDRNSKGYLQAYSQVYSLFGITLRIATAVGEAKWRLYKGSERSERTQIADHPLIKLLDFANEFQTAQEIIELTSLHMDLAGKAYWWLPRNRGGMPGEIWVLQPNLVSIVQSKTEFIAGYTYRISNSEIIPISKDEIIWFPMPDPLNPYGGIGYVQPTQVEVDSEYYAGKWNRNFFYNSARPDGALELEGSLNEEQFKTLREQWSSVHGGVSRAHKIAILEGGMKYKQIQISQKDMDFISLRKQTRESLLFAFGMPLSVMGISENVNRANAEAGDYTFARWLIKPRLNRIKNKLNEKLIPMFKGTEGYEIDFDEVVPETIEQKKELAESGVRSGWMKINEARKLNGFDPIDNGDQLLIPMNMMLTPIESISVNESSPPPQIEAPKSKFLEGHKEAFWKRYVNMAEKYERYLINVLNDIFKNSRDEVMGSISEGHKSDYVNKVEIREAYIDRATPILTDVILESMKLGADLVNPSNPHKDISVNARNLALEWLKTRIVWAAEEIGDSLANDLSKSLMAGFSADESIPELANRVKEFFDSPFRAMRIARTEAIAASSQGTLAGYRESGFVRRVEFYTAIDERTCDYCMNYHQTQFTLGDEIPIPLHPNCRCVYLPVIGG